ncbi:hypothetical protein [Saccharibacillus sp. JS10]|uniref:hypothetical protein n=1 Tax=Saccharibacillus sp. JS10 TaxID=2950552 RepID=UPI00210B6E17|nr:hypothetical protein [Saccharibacillus sp. JS10]MCQ4088410.1 hypothetical protein [Saccharibacillus sp. JS10]
MKYLDMLRMNRSSTQAEIENILKRNAVQPVGNGYIDLIVTDEYIESFLTDLTQANIIVESISWWCHCKKYTTSKNGYVSGMGGPKSHYFEGWFSEMQLPLYTINEKELAEVDQSNVIEKVKTINDRVRIHLRSLKHKEFGASIIPALWLFVPEEWDRDDNEFTK